MTQWRAALLGGLARRTVVPLVPRRSACQCSAARRFLILPKLPYPRYARHEHEAAQFSVGSELHPNGKHLPPKPVQASGPPLLPAVVSGGGRPRPCAMPPHAWRHICFERLWWGRCCDTVSLFLSPLTRWLACSHPSPAVPVATTGCTVRLVRLIILVLAAPVVARFRRAANVSERRARRLRNCQIQVASTSSGGRGPISAYRG